MARRWLKQERRTKEELFDALVRNALGFVKTCATSPTEL